MRVRLFMPDAPAGHRLCIVLCALALSSLSGQALAQQPTVYRCGQAYTNEPPVGVRCERLPEQQVTVIEGTRVQRPPALAIPPRATASAPDTVSSLIQPATAQPLGQGPAQAVRDEQARNVLMAEYERTRERLQALQQEQRQLQTATSAVDATRMQSLEQALARTRRDLLSLQRELDRKPSTGGPR